MASGCPVAYMMSDRLVCEFKGRIYTPSDQKGISSVKVNASCKETKLDPPLQTISGDNGLFTLHGRFTGALDDCELSFEHPQFKRKVVKLKPARELTADTGFSRVWTLNVELEPN
jgi:hypothetical protein